MCYFASTNYFFMKKFLVLYLSVFFFFSCNDGEIIVKNFNFENVPLRYCGQTGNYIFYKENSESFETLSFKLSTQDNIFSEAKTRIYPLNESNFVNYRRYDGPLGQDYFCSSIPPSTPVVTEEYKAVSGTSHLIITFEYDEDKLRKHIQIILKDLILKKGQEQIIIETLDMGTIENIQVIDL